MTDTFLHAQEKEEVWRTYELVTKTSNSSSFRGGSGYLIVIDSFALTGHNIKLSPSSTSIALAKVDQRYKSKIITRVSTNEEDSLPRELTFVWKTISTTFVKKSYWMIYDSLKVSDRNIPQYLSTGYSFLADVYGICFSLMNGTAEPTSRTEFQIEEPSVSGTYFLKLNYDQGTGPFYPGVVYESYYNPYIKPQDKRAPYFAFWDAGSSSLMKDDRRVVARLYKRVDNPCCNEVSGVKVVQLDSTAVSVVWNEAHPKPAIGYKISIENKEDNSIVVEDTISSNCTAYSYKGLKELTDYTLSVTSICGENFSSDPRSIAFRTKFTSCHPVSNIIVDPQQSDVVLQWTAPDSPYIPDSSFYRITINKDEELSINQEVSATQSKPFCPTYTCFAANTLYNYTITTICSDGSFSVPSIPMVGQFTTNPCPEVSEVKITPTFTQSSLSWIHNPTVCMGYHLSLASQNQNPIEVDIYPKEDDTVINYRFDSLLTDNLYTYTITPLCRYGGLGESTSGEFTTLSCEQVKEIHIKEIHEREATLTWTPLKITPYAYHIKITDTKGALIEENDNLSATATSFRCIRRLLPNTTYLYSIAAKCTENITGEPVTGEFTTLPCPQVADVKIEVGISDVSLTWTSAYQVLVVLKDENGDTIKYAYCHDSFSYSDLDANMSYRYSIFTVCTNTETGLSEPVTDEFTTLPCPQVSDVKIEVGMSDVSLTWTKNGDYTLVVLTDANGDTIKYAPYCYGSFGYSRLESNTTYQYSLVTKCTANGWSEVTGEFTTLPCPQVSDVKVEAGITKVSLTWAESSYHNHVFLLNVNGDTIKKNSYARGSCSFSDLEPNTVYQYSIVTKCTETGLSVPVHGEFTTLPCPQVSDVKVEAGITKVSLTWAESSYSAHVVLYDAYGDSINGYFFAYGACGFANLEPNTTYRYKIVTQCTETGLSEPVSGEFTTLPCPQVSDVKVEVSMTDVSLTWAESSYPAHVVLYDAYGDSINGYFFAYGAGGFANLEPNTTYRYKIVTQCTETGLSEPVSGEFTTLPCPQVSDVKVEAGITKVSLIWSESFYPAHVVLYDAYGDSINGYFFAYGTCGFANLEPNTTYRYKIVTQCTETGLSEPVSGEFTTLPCLQVSDVKVEVSMTDVSLTWAESSYLAHVVLYEAYDDSINGYFFAYGAGGFANLEPNTTYRYKIVTQCTETGLSEPVSGEFTTLPCPQVSDVKVEVSMTDVSLTWSESSYPAHVVLYDAYGDSIYESFAYGTCGFAGLEPNTTYRYKIVTQCTETGLSEPVSGEFTTLPCPQVSDVQIEVGQSNVKLNWDSSESETSSYNVTLSKDIVGAIVSQDVDEPYFSYDGLRPNTNYFYNIVAQCEDGFWSQPVTGSFKTLSNNVGNTPREESLSVQVYPNPNTGEAIVETKEDIRMEVFSPTGKLIESKNMSMGKHTIRFDSKGVFIIQFSTASGITMKRIVIL